MTEALAAIVQRADSKSHALLATASALLLPNTLFVFLVHRDLYSAVGLPMFMLLCATSALPVVVASWALATLVIVSGHVWLSLTTHPSPIPPPSVPVDAGWHAVFWGSILANALFYASAATASLHRGLSVSLTLALFTIALGIATVFGGVAFMLVAIGTRIRRGLVK